MNPRPREVKAKILLHQRIGSDYFRLQLACPEIARLARPGQFIMLRITDLKDPFLRRPFSFSRIFPPLEVKKNPLDEGGVEICYQTVGRGTRLMTQLQEGQRIDLLGPLGNGFWPEDRCTRVILVGGGIGVPPLLSWAQGLRKKGSGKKRSGKASEGSPEMIFLMGAKSKEKIMGVGECRKWGIEVQVATEDGSLGAKGMVTDLLERELMTGQHGSTALYACGPNPMLVQIAQVAEQFDRPCQVLLESRMACGVGACLGCTVKYREEREPIQFSAHSSQDSPAGEEGEEKENREGAMPMISETPPFRYARVCKEGPVFDARKIFWD
ncbi:MAG TPA: dihydroorotate dehydrogenase electron transfer subunit [Thermodesulfobacteriota bacterium]|nr:dihydroorotate dehydrogenase electron transfer subunit [Thermodesulfobacteriota bacterium]